MRRGVVLGIVGGVLLLAVAGAVLFYLLAVPGMLTSSYKERAEPEYEKADDAMRPVYAAFSRDTFGVDNRPIEKAKRPGQYVKAIVKVTGENLRDLGRARRTIKRAEQKLDEIDEDDLTDVPDWPLMDGRGDLDTVEKVAGEQDDYLRKARAFLRDFRTLVDYESDAARFFRRAGLTFGRAGDAVPDNPTSPGQVTRPIDRGVRENQSQARRFKRVKVPRERRAEHRNQLAAVDFVVAELRRFSSALKRLDLGTAQQVDKRLASGSKRYDRVTQKHFQKLIRRSRYVKQMDDLERRERRILRTLDDL
jgi:hypothetical protein